MISEIIQSNYLYWKEESAKEEEAKEKEKEKAEASEAPSLQEVEEEGAKE